jgi:hypothetical protein
VVRLTFRLGRELRPLEDSANGLYALVSRGKDITLRITWSKELAAELCEESRYLAECWITDCRPVVA